MWIVVFLLNVYFVSGTCLNGGENHDGTCVCQNGYTGRHCQIEPYNSCVKDTVKQILSNNAVVNGSPYPVCNGTNDNCYYRPGLPVSSKCLATFGSCNAHFTADYTATCVNGCTADAFQEDCCIEHAKCEAHVCAETIGQDTNKERLIYNTGTSGWVITHTEDGACKNDDWRFDKVDLYDTIPEVVENCRTFIEFVGLGYACHQTKRWCTGTPMVCFYVKSAAAVHQSECEVGKLQGSGDNLFRLTWATSTATYDTSGAWGFHSLKTHTATDVTKFDTPEYFESLDSDGAECCKYKGVCEDYNSVCALPLKNVGSDISEDGGEASECCEPKTWRCDHSGHTCGTGFKVNTEKCGLECATSFTTTLLGEYTGIPITSGSKNNCIGDEQGILTSDECLEKCKGRDNYFIKNEICYCADGITSQCVADVGSACDCDIEHKTFAPDTPGYYTVSENTLTVCKSWTRVDCNNRDGWDYLDIQEGDGYNAGQYQACVKGSYGNYYSGDCGTGESNTCCDPIRYDTYRIDTTVTRNESLCCDIDTGITLTACLSQACPDRHNDKIDYDTGFYTTSHTTECCTEIAQTNYCDTFANGAAFDCQNGQVSSGVLDCGGTCSPTDCCKDAVPCDTNTTCGGNNAIDTSYRCSKLEGGVCHSDEYTGTNACCQPDNCDSSNYYSRYSGEYNYQLSSPRNYVGDPKSGCTSKNDWFSVYKPGYLTTVGPTEFEEKCCRYFERCNENICSDVQVVKSRSSYDLLYQLIYCWDNSGNDVICTVSDRATCCEDETCQTADERHDCPDDKTLKQNSNALGRRITDESDFQNSCCENLPDFYTTTRIDKIISGGEKLYTFINGGWGASTFNRWTLGGTKELSKTEEGLVDMALDGTDLYLAFELYGTSKFYKISGDSETATALSYTPSKIAADDGRYAVLSKNPTNLYLDDAYISPSASYMSWNSRIDMSKDWIAMSADGYLSMRDNDGSWTHFDQCSLSSEVINSNVQIAGIYVAAACSNDKIYIWKYVSSWVLHKSISGYSMQIAMSAVHIAVDLRGEIKVYTLSDGLLVKIISGHGVDYNGWRVNSMTFEGINLFIATYDIQSNGTYIYIK